MPLEVPRKPSIIETKGDSLCVVDMGSCSFTKEELQLSRLEQKLLLAQNFFLQPSVMTIKSHVRKVQLNFKLCFHHRKMIITQFEPVLAKITLPFALTIKEKIRLLHHLFLFHSTL